MNKYLIFQHNLPYIRKMCGLSCADLAEMLDIPREAIRNYECYSTIKDKTKWILMYHACTSAFDKLLCGDKSKTSYLDKYVEMLEELVDPNDPKWKDVRRGV